MVSNQPGNDRSRQGADDSRNGSQDFKHSTDKAASDQGVAPTDNADLRAAVGPRLERQRETLMKCAIADAIGAVSEVYFKEHFKSPWKPDERQLKDVQAALVTLNLSTDKSSPDSPEMIVALGFFRRALNNLRAFDRLKELEDIDGTYSLSRRMNEGKVEHVRLTDAKEAVSETCASLWLVGRAMFEASTRPGVMKILVDEMKSVLDGQKSTQDLNGLKQFHFNPIVGASLIQFIEESLRVAKANLKGDDLGQMKLQIERAVVFCGIGPEFAHREVENSFNRQSPPAQESGFRRFMRRTWEFLNT